MPHDELPSNPKKEYMLRHAARCLLEISPANKDASVRFFDWKVHKDRHRVLAAEQLRFTEIPCQVRRDLTPEKAAIADWASNHHRSLSIPIQDADAFSVALAGGMTQKELARNTGMSVSFIQGRLRLLRVPRGIADRLGLDLPLETADPFLLLEDHPALLEAAALVKVPPGSRGWDVDQLIADSLVKKGLVVEAAPSEEQHKAMGGYSSSAWQKRVEKLPRLRLGNSAYTTEAAALQAIFEEEAANWAAREPQVGGKTQRSVEEVVRLRTAKRLAVATQMMAAPNLKGLVSWSDDYQLFLVRLALDYNITRKADRAFLVEATGLSEEQVSKVMDRQFGRNRAAQEELLQKLWTDDRVNLYKLVAGVLMLRHMGHGHRFDESDTVRARFWTGKTPKEITADVEAQVRRELAAKVAKGKGRNSRPGKVGGKQRKAKVPARGKAKRPAKRSKAKAATAEAAPAPVEAAPSMAELAAAA